MVCTNTPMMTINSSHDFALKQNLSKTLQVRVQTFLKSIASSHRRNYTHLALALFIIISYSHLPSAIATTNSLDAIYVIGMKHCTQRWQQVNMWAAANNLTINPIYGYKFSDIHLTQPPIPVTNLQQHDIIMAGQVACTASHIRAWRQAFTRNHSNVVILEDDVRMSASLLQNLSSILHSAEQGSKLRNGLHWHYIYLRMQPTKFLNTRQVWHQNLRVANPGWGTAAYIVSAAGIRFLLTRVTSYSHPLDVQIERFQHGKDTQGAQFIALDACGLNSAGNFPVGCPDNIHELTIAQRGNCFFSASNAGEEFHGDQFPGVKG